MRTKPGRNLKSSSWPKTVVKKWLNSNGGADELSPDCNVNGGGQGRRKSCSDKDSNDFNRQDPFAARRTGHGEWLVDTAAQDRHLINPLRLRPDPPAAQHARMFVGTWNVGGRAPLGHGEEESLSLTDWLQPGSSNADIYVLGFQEIVPLNAGNVLGREDKGPAATWLSLIRRALNSSTKGPDLSPNYSAATRSELRPAATPTARVSFSDLLSADDDADSPSTNHEELGELDGGYCLVASKQMVGIFLSVWVRTGLSRHVSSVKVSCVGRGIMGYMGNKGSVSISMTLGTSTYCFVCTHLTSGEKEGDELRRNSDVTEILRRTRFPQSRALFGRSRPASPDGILEHDRIVWLGDLNYRLATGWADMHDLLYKKDWQSLLQKDQLQMEQRAGRILVGWQEGKICFPPTYKYLFNSASYAVTTTKSGHKRRTPAWCDRILWRGKGMKQIWYLRGESRFSDHRPVSSLFSLALTSAYSHLVEYMTTTSNNSNYSSTTNNTSSSSSSSSSSSLGRVQAEELLHLPTRTHSFRF